jgi:hypothetical protein
MIEVPEDKELTFKPAKSKEALAAMKNNRYGYSLCVCVCVCVCVVISHYGYVFFFVITFGEYSGLRATANHYKRVISRSYLRIYYTHSDTPLYIISPPLYCRAQMWLRFRQSSRGTGRFPGEIRYCSGKGLQSV